MLRYVGQSGKRYIVQGLLQSKVATQLHVRLAVSDNHNYVLKEVPRSEYDYLRNVYSRIGDSEHLRLPCDFVHDHSIFVYQYLASDLLSLAQKDLPLAATKRILRDVLHGLARLHDCNIVHGDAKANNILIDWKQEQENLVIKKVQLADLEDAVYVPPENNIVRKQIGNFMWRSPEAHAAAPVNTYSDIFSFGVVCIYAVLKQLIFAVTDEELAEGEEALSVVLERQIPYFADEDGLNRLIKHLGDSPWTEVFQVTKSGFNKNNPRKPFSLWVGVDEKFKSLISGLTCFDPAGRFTAHEALAHSWFRD